MIDKKFGNAIKIVLKHEGGYVWDPVDPGGETNYGISKRQYPGLDIKELKLSEAMTIYKEDYWLRGKYNQIRNDNVAAKVFDTAVNMGISRANKMLQTACNNFSKRKLDDVLAVDGILGPHTFNILNEIPEYEILKLFRAEQWGFYKRLIARKPEMKKYENGWRNRTYFDGFEFDWKDNVQ